MEFCKHYAKVAWTRARKNGKHTDGDSPAEHCGGLNPDRDNLVLFTRLACNQWSCPHCAKKLQKKWRAFLAEKLPQLSTDWQLLTLTSKGSIREQLASYRALQTGIDKFMKRIRRVHGEIEYVRTFEAHKRDKALHAHFIISGLQPFVVPGCWKNLTTGYLAVTVRTARIGFWKLQTYLKQTAFECGMGYMADARPLPSYQAVNYVTKYLTKELQDINIKGLRHVQTTRGIGSPQVSSEFAWQVSDYITARDFQAGEKVIDLQTGIDIPAEYWADFDVYPPEMN